MTLTDLGDHGRAHFDHLWDEAMTVLHDEVYPLALNRQPNEMGAVLKLAVFRALEIGQNHWHATCEPEPLEEA